MEEQEVQVFDRCDECAEFVDDSVGRSFTFAEEGLLCWQCAERRGGVFDEAEDRWVTPPDLSGLRTATPAVP